MAEPFQSRHAVRPGLLERLFDRRGKASAMREVESLLAGAARVSQVPAEEVEQIGATRGLDLGEACGRERRGLYRRYLQHCLADSAFSPEETADLLHLKTILHLGEADVAAVHDEVVHAAYGRAIDQVLADHRLDPEEEQFLERLRKELQLPQEIAERLYQEGSDRSRQKYLYKTISDEHVLFAPKETTLRLTGTSTTTLEDAVDAAIGEATQAVLDLRWAEVVQIRVETEAGRVARWNVVLKAGLDRNE